MNPSLTITAQAERAMSFWPNKGEADTRPDLGADYAAWPRSQPGSPAVPEDALGALRLPIVGRQLRRFRPTIGLDRKKHLETP